MLFNSPPFLFVFLPATLAGAVLLGRWGRRMVMAWLAVASIVFYAWWDIAHAWPMAASILFNFGCGLALAGLRHGRWGTPVLTAAVAADLAFLGWFKYAHFAATTLGLSNLDPGAIFLPLGISFFTFTQLAYLVDVRRGIATDADFLSYVLFVTFFPHLIAGPIIHHKEMMPQFMAPQHRNRWDDFAVGSALFTIGLFKKVMLADPIAAWVSPAFSAAAGGHAVPLLPAWLAAVAYALQIYLDFSGYSDMAVGLARMFGIDLPLNFDSPYQSRSIIAFWRRWHMTLSRFLRDYLYYSLGGNRRGPVRRHLNLMAVMLIGGLWHGANWTFVAWGGLHGVYLMANHGWHRIRPRSSGRVEDGLGWALTLVAVIIAWVFFRAPSLDAALVLLHGMAGLDGVGADKGPLLSWDAVAWCAALMAMCLAAPNSQQILRLFEPGLRPVAAPAHFARLCWRSTPVWAGAAAALALASISHLWSATEFLYYRF
jgi:D-alanyl-lipoteichoic acid acyltransferase DltB (MBOAT superfamily)